MEMFCRGTVTLPRRNVALSAVAKTMFAWLLNVTVAPQLCVALVSLPGAVLGFPVLYPAASKWKCQRGSTAPHNLLHGDNNDATDLKAFGYAKAASQGFQVRGDPRTYPFRGPST